MLHEIIKIFNFFYFDFTNIVHYNKHMKLENTVIKKWKLICGWIWGRIVGAVTEKWNVGCDNWKIQFCKNRDWVVDDLMIKFKLDEIDKFVIWPE